LDLLQENLDHVEQKFKNETNNLKKKHITESEELKAKIELLKKNRADMDANTKRLQQLNKVKLSRIEISPLKKSVLNAILFW
jgi:hypothetical protein